tara:strand:- start:31185 stop:31544 length:360 start_codon:yes stop_codon:yes gene_type:complete
MFKPQNTSTASSTNYKTYIQYPDPNQENNVGVAEIEVCQCEDELNFYLRPKNSNIEYSFYKDEDGKYRSSDETIIEFDDEGNEYEIAKPVTNKSLIEAFEVALNYFEEDEDKDINYIIF